MRIRHVFQYGIRKDNVVFAFKTQTLWIGKKCANRPFVTLESPCGEVGDQAGQIHVGDLFSPFLGELAHHADPAAKLKEPAAAMGLNALENVAGAWR